MAKNKAIQLESGRGVQFPKSLAIANGFIHSIDENDTKVNLVKIKNRSKQVGERAAVIADSYGLNTSNGIISNSSENVNGNNLDVIKIASAYGKTVDVQGFIDSSEILYVNPNKKAVHNWLSVNRLKLPMPSSQYGLLRKMSNSSPNNSISKSDENVNKKRGGRVKIP